MRSQKNQSITLSTSLVSSPKFKYSNDLKNNYYSTLLIIPARYTKQLENVDFTHNFMFKSAMCTLRLCFFVIYTVSGHEA